MTWHEFALGDLNIGDGKTVWKIEDVCNLIENYGISVFFGQEFGDRADVVAAVLEKHPSWRVVWHKSKNKYRDVPILFDSKVWKKTFWTELQIHIGYLGPQGAGGDNPGFKALNVVRLKHRKARRTVQFQNHHTIASAFSTHGPEGARRKAAYTRQIREFFAWVRKGKIVIGGGDWNAEKTNKIIKHLKPAHWIWVNTKATMRTNTIDLIGFTLSGKLKFVKAVLLETSGSKFNNDHRAVVVTFRIR